MRKLSVLMLFFLFIFNVYALKYSVDTNEIDFGQNVRFLFEADTGENIVDFSPEFENFSIFSVDTNEKKVDLNIFPVSEGNTFIKPQKLILSNGSDTFEIKTNTIEITVFPVIEDTQEFKPAPLAPFFQLNSRYNIRNISILLILILIFSGIILYFVFRKKIAVKLLEKVTEKPHKRALRELDELKLKNYLEQNRQKEFCLELSAILRNYIEGRFMFYCSEMTTSEIERAYFDDKNKIPDFLDILKMSQKMDLVKFAKYSLDKEVLEEMYNTSRQYVMKTREADTDENRE